MCKLGSESTVGLDPTPAGPPNTEDAPDPEPIRRVLCLSAAMSTPNVISTRLSMLSGKSKRGDRSELPRFTPRQALSRPRGGREGGRLRVGGPAYTAISLILMSV